MALEAAASAAVAGGTALVRAFTHERRCLVKVNVPSSITSWTEEDRYESTGNLSWGYTPGEVEVEFFNDGSFSGAVKLKSDTGEYLIIASSNPHFGGNKTRAYFGDGSRKTYDVWDDMGSWGEVDTVDGVVNERVRKGNERERLKLLSVLGVAAFTIASLTAQHNAHVCFVSFLLFEFCVGIYFPSERIRATMQDAPAMERSRRKQLTQLPCHRSHDESWHFAPPQSHYQNGSGI
ncbi:Leucine-rich repeat protein SHOC-2 [Durusdinium trenchii]|uniref:Leucine-rich repeat protein SHOC-2 n=1 Tax=Durusdinium trenchii TaxID=1381693 RepID=A0ABP0M656_9DINO